MKPKGTRPPPRRVGRAFEALPEAIALTLVAALPAFMNLVSAGLFEEEKSLLVRAAALLALPGVWLASRDLGALAVVNDALTLAPADAELQRLRAQLAR